MAEKTRKFYQHRNRQIFRNKKNKTRWKEFGRAGQDILNKYGLSGENPDSLIASKGMSHLDDIERDTHLSSCLATRRAKLIRKGFRIIPYSEKPRHTQLADFISWNFENMEGSFLKDLEAMLTAVGRGFSLTEINYQYINWRGNQYIGLKSLRFKDQKLFSFKFDDFGYYKINQIDPDPGGVELPSDKFIHIVTGPDDENPYGKAASAECAFWVWVKKNVAKFWAIFAEKFGMPLAMVTIPRNIEPGSDEYTKIEEILEGIQEETGIRVPEGFAVEFLEATRNGEAGYERFVEICNKEISKRVFGATLIAEEGKRGQGSYALGQEHSEIFEEYVTFDAAVLEAAINEQLIKRLINYNWDIDEYPRFEFIEFNPGIFITFSQSIQNLVNSGLKIGENWVCEKLRIPKLREGEKALEMVKPPAQSPQGADNKIKMADIIDTIREEFKEDPGIKDIFKDIDKLSDRYRDLMAGEFDRLAEIIKKKSLTQNQNF